MRINFDPASRQPRSVFAQVLTLLLSLLVLGAAFFFSLVFFAVLAIAGGVFWLYFWWKTREFRRQLRERAREAAPGNEPSRGGATPGAASSGDIIEGESVRVSDERGSGRAGD